MRILMVANGRVVHSRKPLTWLRERGCRVRFLDTAASTDAPGSGETPYPHNRSAVPYYVGRIFGNTAGALSRRALDVIRWIRLRLMYVRFRGDLAHVHWIDVEAYECARAGVRPLVLTAWGTDINQFFQPHDDARLRRLREQVVYALRRCDRLITDAPDLVRRCETLAGRPLRHDLLPLGIDTAAFSRDLTPHRQEWRDRLGIPRGAFVFGSFRELRPHYNHDLIIAAFARMNERDAHDAFLLFKVYLSQGRVVDPTYEDTLRAQAERLGVSQRIVWVKDIPTVALPEMYATVDALVNFPRMDGFPVHFLEGAAASRPIVSCRLPAYEWGFAAETVSFVDPGDTDALANAMGRLIAERADSSTVARLAHARTTVLGSYDERSTGQRLLEIYREVCAHRVNGAPASGLPQPVDWPGRVTGLGR